MLKPKTIRISRGWYRYRLKNWAEKARKEVYFIRFSKEQGPSHGGPHHSASGREGE